MTAVYCNTSGRMCSQSMMSIMHTMRVSHEGNRSMSKFRAQGRVSIRSRSPWACRASTFFDWDCGEVFSRRPSILLSTDRQAQARPIIPMLCLVYGTISIGRAVGGPAVVLRPSRSGLAHHSQALWKEMMVQDGEVLAGCRSFPNALAFCSKVSQQLHKCGACQFDIAQYSFFALLFCSIIAAQYVYILISQITTILHARDPARRVGVFCSSKRPIFHLNNNNNYNNSSSCSTTLDHK